MANNQPHKPDFRFKPEPETRNTPNRKITVPTPKGPIPPNQNK